MKKRLTPIITLTVAILLVGSIAYAAEKRRQSNVPSVRDPEAIPEDEALKAELLAATEEHQEKLTSAKAASSTMSVEEQSDTARENQKTTDN